MVGFLLLPVQTHCGCLRLVTGRKGLAVSLAGQSLSHAGVMNTKDVRNEKGTQIIRYSEER